MRRLLAITLLIAFGLPLMAATAVLRVGGDSGLPACCRKHGIHHCSGAALGGEHGPVLAAPPCSRCPSVATVVRIADATLFAMRQPGAGLVELGLSAALTDGGAITREECAAHPKRGPPSANL